MTADGGSGAKAPLERSLDPDDWSAVRALGHEMVDDMIDFLRTVRERPVWKAPPAATKAALARELPRKGTPLSDIYAGFREHVMPYSLGNTHPRFWGWVNGTGTATGMLADLLAAGLNAHVAFGNQAPIEVERRVIAWMAELLGFPQSASGILVSSGSVANLTGLTVGRDTILPEVIQRGVRPLSGQPTIYGSDEVHNSVDKMVGLLGLGREAFRRIPTRPDFTADVPAIARAIADDRARGLLPFAIVGTAGTVATGAIDDLGALADLARSERLWFHVDAAFGAALALAPKLAPRLAGIDRADSVAFDFHKWFYVPYDVGCVLVRDGARHQESFSPPASYLSSMDRGIAAGGVPFGRLGVDLSRGFRALKVWMSLLEHGTDRYGEQVEQNVAQAGYLADRIREHPELELLAPVPLNVVCFRHRPAGVADPAALDRHNQTIVMELHERGIAAPSFATVRGAFAIRAAITNHRSRREDFDAMVDGVLAIGREIAD